MICTQANALILRDPYDASFFVNITLPVGTGDLAAVYDQLLEDYGQDTKFVGIGYSLGAYILVNFLGEDKSRQERFLCAMSICQGYDQQE